MTHTNIVIVFNPNSTGSAPEKARFLASELTDKLPRAKVVVWPTEHAGHAFDLTIKAAKDYSRPLVISVSGDGGYNEVINGALSLPAEKQPICAVYPAGNANDHRRATKQNDLVAAIISGKVTRIDVLKLTTKAQDASQTRYAHSYIGFGITPAVAVQLNKTDLNALRELIIVVRAFWRYQPFVIEQGGKKRQLNSLVFANIPEMAKVVTLSNDASLKDGRFEVVTIPAHSKLHLLHVMARAAIGRPITYRRASSESFATISPMPIQLDGEVMELKQNTTVTITSERQVLDTVL